MSATQQCNLYKLQKIWVLGRNDPALGAKRPRNWGGTSTFGADVGRIDRGGSTLGRIERKPTDSRLCIVRLVSTFLEECR